MAALKVKQDLRQLNIEMEFLGDDIQPLDVTMETEDGEEQADDDDDDDDDEVDGEKEDGEEVSGHDDLEPQDARVCYIYRYMLYGIMYKAEKSVIMGFQVKIMVAGAISVVPFHFIKGQKVHWDVCGSDT